MIALWWDALMVNYMVFTEDIVAVQANTCHADGICSRDDHKAGCAVKDVCQLCCWKLVTACRSKTHLT